MKVTKDKKALMVKRYNEGMPMYEIALELHTTRASIYRWLNEEGIILNRRGLEGNHKRSSKTGLLAEKLGVSMPTARKYTGVLKDAEIAGHITLEELKKIGIRGTQQKIVLAFLDRAGYSYYAEEMILMPKVYNGAVDRLLGVHEVVELFTDPGRFLDES